MRIAQVKVSNSLLQEEGRLSHCTLCTAVCTALCSEQSTLYNEHSKVHSAHCTVNSQQYSLYIHNAEGTLHYAQCRGKPVRPLHTAKWHLVKSATKSCIKQWSFTELHAQCIAQCTSLLHTNFTCSLWNLGGLATTLLLAVL